MDLWGSYNNAINTSSSVVIKEQSWNETALDSFVSLCSYPLWIWTLVHDWTKRRSWISFLRWKPPSLRRWGEELSHPTLFQCFLDTALENYSRHISPGDLREDPGDARRTSLRWPQSTAASHQQLFLLRLFPSEINISHIWIWVIM